MPIVVPEGGTSNSLYARLKARGADLAQAQDLAPDSPTVRVGLLNLMPATCMRTTEEQWLHRMSHTGVNIEPVLIKFDNDPRGRPGSSREEVLRGYAPISRVTEAGLHGLIVTGDNQELRRGLPPGQHEALPFDEITYAGQLTEVVRWARRNVGSTIYSCLASQFALNALYGIPRTVGQKTFGVYEHEITAPGNEFTQGLGETVTAPHSRWGNVPPKLLTAEGVGLLAVNAQIGWLLAQAPNEAGGTDLFAQGHPEYDRLDLHGEHMRDQQAPPDNYYQNGQPQFTWGEGAQTLHQNWITFAGGLAVPQQVQAPAFA